MRYLITAVLLISSAFATDKSCVILSRHQHRFGENFSRWTAHKPLDYVEGEFPHGIKFKNELGDKQVREIQDKGGKVVILAPDYKLPDLDDARAQCKAFRESK